MTTQAIQEKDLVKVKKRYFAIAVIVSFFVNFDSSASIPIISAYATYLGAGTFLAGLVAGAYSITHVPSNIILGRLVDRLGRRKPLLLGLALDGFSLILYSVSTDPIQLLLARMIHGAGGGFGGPASMSYLSDTSPRSKSGRIMAIYGIMIGVSYLLGIMLGGIGAHILGFKKLYTYLAVSMFAAAALSSLLPETMVSHREETTMEKELSVFKNIIFNKPLAVSYLSISAIAFNQGIIVSIFALILTQLGYDTRMIGMLFSITVLVSILIHYPSGFLGDKLGKEKPIVLGLVLQAMQFYLLLSTTELNMMILAMAIGGLGHGLVYPNSSAIIRDHTSIEERGIASGIFYALLVAGVAIGAPISSFVAENFSYSMGMSLGMLVPVGIIVLLLPLIKGRE